jgi:acetoin utilization deacetylase AcuC-like enzyme
VHDEAFIGFLRNAFQKFQAKHGRDVVEAFPSSWPARRLRQIPGQDIDGVMGYFCFDTATPILAGTWAAALDAVNCALTAAEFTAQSGEPAFALCRPPGHHAAQDLYGGYCFFNNAAIAAQWLTDRGRRVAILDVDYHHGNGTQEIFDARPDVQVVNIHGDPLTEYPFFLGHADERGSGAGEGFTLNLPLPFGTAFDTWGAALDTACAAVDAYKPDAIVVSLGVDTFEHDPISHFKLRTADYPRIGARIARLGRPTLFVMEGGYAVAEIGENAVGVLTGFEGG